MAVLRCKMCGGTMEILEGTTVAQCEYCGTKQTVPKLDDERKANLYDRANHFRRNNEYDKAMSIYERILDEDSGDAEAYWSLVLCRYGVEYVEDPFSRKRVPTVNRTQFNSIFSDADYKATLDHADVYQREIYEAEAKAIDDIQKGILEISSKEDPFDVFICYKETDNDGRRTRDSVLATDLYHQLTQEGFKVFFSRITLEDKLGAEYEPYIFAALNSAKVMVVLGTKPEFFSAVWVRNEWSRYLALIKNGAKKTLIPAYRDMDPYDLPEEFSHLQAQDMSKLGFMQDLIRGIKKITASLDTENHEVKNTLNSGVSNTEPLLRRANLFLEDNDWESATRYCERVLDQEPENAQAYYIKALAKLKISTEEEFEEYYITSEDIFGDRTLLRAKQFADDTLKAKFEILDKKRDIAIETARIEKKKIEEQNTLLHNVRNAIHFISTGISHTIAVKADGTVMAAGENLYDRCNVSDWEDIISVAAGNAHTVGIKSDGSVVATGLSMYRACDVKSWSEILSVAAGDYHTLGLKKDGTVLGVGDNEYGQIEVDNWNNVIAISAGYDHSVALKRDGTVIAVGDNRFGQCNVKHWENITSICAGPQNTIGISSDGEVLFTGKDAEIYKNEIKDWTDIVQASISPTHIIGLKRNGTVIVSGDTNLSAYYNEGDWKDVIVVSAGENYSVGLKANGQVIASGDNSNGQCNVSSWKLFQDISTYETEATELKEKRRTEKIKEQEERQKAKFEKLKTERERLVEELSQISGVFSGFRKRQIEERIRIIDLELK